MKDRTREKHITHSGLLLPCGLSANLKVVLEYLPLIEPQLTDGEEVKFFPQILWRGSQILSWHTRFRDRVWSWLYQCSHVNSVSHRYFFPFAGNPARKTCNGITCPAIHTWAAAHLVHHDVTMTIFGRSSKGQASQQLLGYLPESGHLLHLLLLQTTWQIQHRNHSWVVRIVLLYSPNVCFLFSRLDQIPHNIGKLKSGDEAKWFQGKKMGWLKAGLKTDIVNW